LHAVRRPPHRRLGRHGARSVTVLLLVAGLALAGAGVRNASAETPAQKITRLRNRAAEVQASIDRMNDQVETVVEQFNANHEARQATLDRQRETTQRIDQARKRLAAATEVMGDRVRAIYMGGPVTGLEQLLEVRSVTDAVTVSQYQQTASASDAQTVAAVQRNRQALESISAELNAQRRRQEQLQAQLDGQRRDIQRQLADQQAFMSKLSADVKRAVAEEQQRQEELRRQELARKLAAEKAAAEKAAREEAARQRAARAATAAAVSATSSGSDPGSGSGSGGGPDSGGSAGSDSGGSSGGSDSGSGSVSSSSSVSRSSSGGGSSSGSSGSGNRSSGSSSPASSGASAPSSAARQAVAYAKAQLGKPYIWGAEGPRGFDCSGLTMMAWKSAGVSIPRVSGAQYGIGRHINSMSALEPGDLVFFGHPIHHVGMYVGNGTMIEAPYTGANVRYHSINRSDYAGATRPTG
jgi:cell wall-associated NlpC family hydrolase